MALPDFVLALCLLLSTLLVPIFALYQVLRLKRRAIRMTVPATPRRSRR